MLGLCGNSGVLRSNLIQKMNVDDGILDVRREVGHLTLARRPCKMVVDPAYEYLFRRQLHECIQRLTFRQQCSEVGMTVKVDVGQ